MSALEVILRLRPSKSEAVGLYKKDSRTVVLKNKSGNQEEYKFERVYDGCDNQVSILQIKRKEMIFVGTHLRRKCRPFD